MVKVTLTSGETHNIRNGMGLYVGAGTLLVLNTAVLRDACAPDSQEIVAIYASGSWMHANVQNEPTVAAAA